MNFWTFVLITDIIAAVAFWAFYIPMILETAEKWKQRQPILAAQSHGSDILIWVELLCLSLIPVINVLFLLVCIKCKDEIIEETLNKMLIQALKNRAKDDEIK